MLHILFKYMIFIRYVYIFDKIYLCLKFIGSPNLYIYIFEMILIIILFIIITFQFHYYFHISQY